MRDLVKINILKLLNEFDIIIYVVYRLYFEIITKLENI